MTSIFHKFIRFLLLHNNRREYFSFLKFFLHRSKSVALYVKVYNPTVGSANQNAAVAVWCSSTYPTLSIKRADPRAVMLGNLPKRFLFNRPLMAVKP